MSGGTGMPAGRKVAGALPRTVGLAFMWGALWGDLGAATLTAGVLVAIGVQLAFPALAPLPIERVNIAALAKLGLVFTWMLITANLAVTRLVFSPRVALSTLVVEVTLPPSSDAVATVVANAVTLTPGTLTLDVRRTADAVVLVVHNLDASDADTVRADVLDLHRMAAAAFPSGPRTVPTDDRPTQESRP